MLNTQIFNEAQFNSASLVIESKENLNFYILYNWFYLHDEVNIFSSIQYLESKDNEAEAVWYNKNFWNFYNFQETQKQIKVKWTIRATDRNELLEIIQNLKSKCLNQNQNLIIKDFENKKQVKAFCKKITFSENHYNIVWMDFEASFYTYDYLQEYTPTNWFINTTSNNLSFTITNDGTAQSKLYMVLNFKTATGTTSASLTVGGQTITITEAITSGDVVVLDGYDILIQKNWNLVNFSGEIPVLEVGDNTVTITTNGTVNIDVIYKTNLAYK